MAGEEDNLKRSYDGHAWRKRGRCGVVPRGGKTMATMAPAPADGLAAHLETILQQLKSYGNRPP